MAVESTCTAVVLQPEQPWAVEKADEFSLRRAFFISFAGDQRPLALQLRELSLVGGACFVDVVDLSMGSKIKEIGGLALPRYSAAILLLTKSFFDVGRSIHPVSELISLLNQNAFLFCVFLEPMQECIAVFRQTFDRASRKFQAEDKATIEGFFHRVSNVPQVAIAKTASSILCESHEALAQTVESLLGIAAEEIYTRIRQSIELLRRNTASIHILSSTADIAQLFMKIMFYIDICAMMSRSFVGLGFSRWRSLLSILTPLRVQAGAQDLLKDTTVKQHHDNFFGCLQEVSDEVDIIVKFLPSLTTPAIDKAVTLAVNNLLSVVETQRSVRAAVEGIFGELISQFRQPAVFTATEPAEVATFYCLPNDRILAQENVQSLLVDAGITLTQCSNPPNDSETMVLLVGVSATDNLIIPDWATKILGQVTICPLFVCKPDEMRNIYLSEIRGVIFDPQNPAVTAQQLKRCLAVALTISRVRMRVLLSQTQLSLVCSKLETISTQAITLVRSISQQPEGILQLVSMIPDFLELQTNVTKSVEMLKTVCDSIRPQISHLNTSDRLSLAWIVADVVKMRASLDKTLGLLTESVFIFREAIVQAPNDAVRSDLLKTFRPFSQLSEPASALFSSMDACVYIFIKMLP